MSGSGLVRFESGSNKSAIQDDLRWLSQHREIAPSTFQDSQPLSLESQRDDQRSHKCCVYIANESKYCARLNSIQAFSDINRDVRI